MRKVLLESGLYQLKSLRYEIDGQGMVIFKLPDGGTVRDAGREIHFSAHHEKTGKLAAALAEARWGRAVESDGNCLRRTSLLPQRQSPQLSSPTLAPEVSRSGHGF